MKKNVSKKAMYGIATLAFLCGGVVTYAGSELIWGGEDDVAKVSSILDNLKSEVLNKNSKIKNNKKELVELKEAK